MSIIKEKDLKRIRAILETGWSEDTAYDKKEYRSSNLKSCSQCYVTARTIHHVFGWEIMYKRSRKEDINHYWNRLPDGREIDFTSDQDQFGGKGINKVKGLVGKPKTFKPIRECKSIKPELKRFLRIVEEPLQELKKRIAEAIR